jgi:hypothetical protein
MAFDVLLKFGFVYRSFVAAVSPGSGESMMLDSFLNATDSDRVVRTFQNLAVHGISDWALTGGIAIELQILHSGGQPILRPLHDIDFVTDSLASIPETLGAELLLCHVHPNDPPGKILFQAVDPKTKVRLDVFRAYGSELERALPVTIAGVNFRVISLQDMVAKLARINWDLMETKPAAPKYARDLLRLLEYVGTDGIESIWSEHRSSQCVESFADTARQLRLVIASRPDLLLSPTYSTDVDEVCKRCQRVEAFPLTDRRQILSILGYC